jgi:hypothetical protein
MSQQVQEKKARCHLIPEYILGVRLAQRPDFQLLQGGVHALPGGFDLREQELGLCTPGFSRQSNFRSYRSSSVSVLSIRQNLQF